MCIVAGRIEGGSVFPASAVEPNVKIPAKNPIQKIHEIDQSNLCLQQFDKFSIRSACNDWKRKSCKYAETCL